MRTIQFKYSELYGSDEYGDPPAYTTHLLITLFPKKKLPVLVETVIPCAAEYSGRIIQTLLQCLQDNDFHTRRFAAEGLGRLGPDGVRYLRKTAKNAEHEYIRQDATEALHQIEEAVPHLQEATKDEDKAVRKAATDALNRIQPERT